MARHYTRLPEIGRAEPCSAGALLGMPLPSMARHYSGPMLCDKESPPGFTGGRALRPQAGACSVPYTHENPRAGRATDAIKQRCSSFNHPLPPMVATRPCRRGCAACLRPDATGVGCYEQYPLRHRFEQYPAPIGAAAGCPIAALVRPATHGRAQGPGRGHRHDPGWQGRLCLRLWPASDRWQRGGRCRHVVLGRFGEQGGDSRHHAA
ncbi:hypothetical protein D3C81_1146240 [compost metagenome]